MNFSRPSADIFVPDGATAPDAALARTTHLAIGAHQDDLEIMAYHGIAECYGRADRWFSGVVVTNGAGSPRSGLYAGRSDGEMQAVRRAEQRTAARLGDFGICLQLGHPSAVVKDPSNPAVRADLETIFRGCRPQVIYLHNPADKHDTHVAVMLHCLGVLRDLPVEQRPPQVLGCEVWRDLDWLPDERKVALDASARPHLAAALLGAFDSQIAGGKRYDLATIGRRVANTTYFQSHTVDQATAITWALDLTPLVLDPELGVAEFVDGVIDGLRADVRSRLQRLGSARA